MKVIEKRQEQLIDLCKCLLDSYNEYLNEEERNLVIDTLDNLQKIELTQEIYNIIYKTFIPIVEKIWKLELDSGKYVVISWSKYANAKRKSIITFATLSTKDDIINFCDSDNGVLYQISFEAIIGALQKDGATLKEDMENEYTIGKVQDKFINSYNCATKLILPIQLIERKGNDYKSKHNEIILDSSLIKEIDMIELKNNTK